MSKFAEKKHSMNDAARIVGVHVATIWRWHLSGVRGRRLPTFTIGGRRYVGAADLDAFLRAGNVESTGDADQRRRDQDASRALDGLGL